ncbi:MAG TPA: phosphoglycerate kinase [Alphaproteobacteria bacterium]|nr:phosphoglycerate kinase [Alphaproteobacteria bacterium]
MNLYTLNDFQSMQKTAVNGFLLRLDVNLPLNAMGEISDPVRLTRSLKTLEFLKTQGYVVIIGHFSRPKPGVKDPTLSLKKLCNGIGISLNTPLTFIEDIDNKESLKRVQGAKKGEVFLLENLRYDQGEEKNDPEFAKKLSEFAQVYVNDAFSGSHRAHASVEAITHIMPSFAGFAFEKEIQMLNKVINTPKRPLAAIVGGSKISTKLPLLANLVQKVDYLFVAGAMTHTFLESKGYELGGSLTEGEMIPDVLKIEELAKKSGCKLILPLDVVCCKTLHEGADYQVLPVDGILPDMMAVDFGPNTLKLYEETLKEVQTVLWNGPLGVFEMPPFDRGTNTLANILIKLTKEKKITTIAGGGDTLAALKACNEEE